MYKCYHAEESLGFSHFLLPCIPMCRFELDVSSVLKETLCVHMLQCRGCHLVSTTSSLPCIQMYRFEPTVSSASQGSLQQVSEYCDVRVTLYTCAVLLNVLHSTTLYSVACKEWHLLIVLYIGAESRFSCCPLAS